MKKELIVFQRPARCSQFLREITRKRLIPFAQTEDGIDTLKLINLITNDIFNFLKTRSRAPGYCPRELSAFRDFDNAPPWKRNEFGKIQADPSAILPDNELAERFKAVCAPDIESQLQHIQIEQSSAYLLHPDPDLRFESIHYLYNPVPINSSSSRLSPPQLRKYILDQITSELQEDKKDAAAVNLPIQQFLHPIDTSKNTLSTYKNILSILKDPANNLARSDTEYYVDMTGADSNVQQAFFAILQQGIIRGKQVCMPHRTSINWHRILNGHADFPSDYFCPQLSYEDPLEIWKELQTHAPPKTPTETIRGDTKNEGYRTLTEKIVKVAIKDEAGTFLFLGETGVGKTEMVNRIIKARRQMKMRRTKCISENCATLETLTESTLFGSVRGAFTDAKDHPGRLKEADGGVLFLDEIGELPMPVQAKLLKAIEEKKFHRVGSNAEERSDFQLFCGTNRDLDADVSNNRFRQDLLQRIRVWTFKLPPLRERIKDDIDLLIDEWLNNPDRCTVSPRPYFDPLGRELFVQFATSPSTRWEGNFREFNTMMHRMSVMAKGSCITRNIVEAEIQDSKYYEKFVYSKMDILTKQESPPTPFNQDGNPPYGNNASPSPTRNTIGEIQHAAPHPTGWVCYDDQIISLIGEDKFLKLNGRDRCLLRGVIESCGKAKTQKEAESDFYDNDSGALCRFLKKFGLRFKYREGSPNLECRQDSNTLCE